MMRIRKATLKDLAKIREISLENKFETDRDWKKLIASKESEMFVLVEKNNVIGFCGLIYHKWNNTIQISQVLIRPEYRRQGLGLELVNFLIKRARKTKFRCLMAEAPSLNPSVKMYKKAGFRKCGYNDRYYSNSGKEIALWMCLDLK